MPRSTATKTPNLSEHHDEPQLHKLIRKKLHHLAVNRIEQHPEEAATAVDGVGDLPIEIAAKSPSTPLALVQALLDVYPYHMVMKHCRGKYCRSYADKQKLSPNAGPPLVLAVQNKLSPSIVRYLVTQAGLEGLRSETNPYGQLPLHVAATCDTEVVQLLTRSDLLPSPLLAAAASPDCHGRLPLHCFVQARSKQASLELLLSAYPNALTHQDYEGCLPLHLALKHNASLVMIQCFVASYPKGVRVQDYHGNLPIHYAFCEGARTFNLAKKLQALLRVFPEAALHRNKDGLTPAMLAVQTRKRGFYSSMDYNLEPPIQELLRNERRRVKARHDGSSQEEQTNSDQAQPQSHDDTKRQHRETENDMAERSKQPLSSSCQPGNNTCSVCHTGALSHALVPCGHVVLCDGCAEMDRLVCLNGCCPVQQCRFFRAQLVLGKKNEESPCVICLENPRSHALVPCGHVVVCQDCANDTCLTKLGGTCPLGRCRMVRSFLNIKWT